VAVIAAVVAVPLIHGGPAAAPKVPVTLAGVYSASRYGFNLPFEIAVDSDHVWVTNGNGNSVTELDAGSGALVRTLPAGGYGFSRPVGIVDDGAHIWVANDTGNSVTELNAGDGALLQTLSGGRDSFQFDSPNSLVMAGDHAWAGNWLSPGGHGPVTELTLG
jgi:DNA-binding beta-propeller fold protein YncE